MKLHKHIKDRISNNNRKAFQSELTLYIDDKYNNKYARSNCHVIASLHGHRRPYVLKKILSHVSNLMFLKKREKQTKLLIPGIQLNNIDQRNTAIVLMALFVG